MDIIESGYRYRLRSFEGTLPQEIRFTQRLVTDEFVDGTTNEEVVDMLIARLCFLQGKNPSPENQCIIILLKSIKELLGKRLNKKIKRNEFKKNNEAQWSSYTEELSRNIEWPVQINTAGDGGSKRSNKG